FDERRVQDAYDALRSRIDVAVDEVFAQLPAVDARHARPSDEGRSQFMAVFGTYRRTSPEMVVAGQMIRAALPH
ncbi:MAG: hypothetical protein ACR2PA_18650, partial [Hyphomicrobiaceae bacterium]